MKSLSVSSIVWLVTAALSVPPVDASEPWQSQGPAGTYFHSLAQAPDGSILAGTVSGLFRFDDSDRGWRPIPLDQPGVGLVFVSSDGVMFSQTYSSGCISAFRHFVSIDDGETWTCSALPGRSLLVNGDRLVAGSDRDGVWLADLPPSVRRPSGRAGGR